VPVDLIEPKNAPKSITLTIDYHLTGTETIGVKEYAFSDAASGSVTYTISHKTSAKRACGIATNAELLALLDPGEFLIGGSCCCPCGGLLVVKPFGAADRVAAGSRSYSNVDPTDPAPVPAAKQILFAAVFTVDFTACRKNLAAKWTADGFTANRPSIEIADVTPGGPGRNAEVTVIITPDFPGPALIEGTATLSWENPDGSPASMDIVANVDPETFAPNLGATLDALCTQGPNGVVTRIQNGIKIGFIGNTGFRPAPSIEVTDNSLFASPLHPAKEHFTADYSLYFADDSESAPAAPASNDDGADDEGGGEESSDDGSGDNGASDSGTGDSGSGDNGDGSDDGDSNGSPDDTGDSDTPLAPFFVQHQEGFNKVSCTGQFVFSNPLTNAPGTLTGSVSSSS
jgi:hypothetical protein